MTKGAIYYSDNRLDPVILNACQKQLKTAFDGEIVSCTLKPMDFGKNIVYPAQRGYFTMISQILLALDSLTTDIVFFCEHDVLYHPTHFDFTPTKDIFYYDLNNWRWDYPKDRAINYEGLSSLSLMCCNRELALNHYKKRVETAIERGYDKLVSKEPSWGRMWGYEPGTKPTNKGGFSDEEHEKWTAEFPCVDIRHHKTFSRPKVNLYEFKHPPKLDTWQVITLDQIPGWNIKQMFNL